MMKRLLLLLAVAGISVLQAGTNDPALIFKADFDRYTAKPDHTAGNTAVAGINPDLSLRMFPGVAGKGNAVNLKGSEKIIYKAHKNFNSRQGTVSFWIAPQEWNYGKKGLTSFFQTKLGKYTFIIYEENQYKTFSFVIVQYKPKYRELGKVRLDMTKKEWSKGRWHKIDAVWNEKMMALYLDGALATPRKYNKNPWLFDAPVKLPEIPANGIMWLGWGNKKVQDTTAFDDLRIYDRTLSASEIKLAYEKKIPRMGNSRSPQVAVPNGKKITLDGKLDAAEWRDAAAIVLRNPEAAAKGYKGMYAKVRLKKDKDNLMLAAELLGGSRASVTGNDIVDIWKDDAFEFHIMTAGKKRYQFILNAAGALFDAVVDRNDGIYDQRKLNPRWQSGAKHAVKKGNGKWYLEMVIPRKNIGALQSRLQVNFAATRWTDTGEHINWGTDCQKFYDEKRFGTLIFNSKRAPVQMDECLFTDGEFRLELTPGVNARLITSDGKIMPRPAGKSWRVALPEGIYEFSAQGREFFYATRIAASKPFEMDYTGRPSLNRIDVHVDLAGAGSGIRKAINDDQVKCTVSLMDENKKVRASKTFAVKTLRSTFPLTLPELTRGTWQVKAVISEKGKETLSSQKRLRIPDMTPFRAKVEQNHTVPPPWTPVKELGNGKFEVWNRVYTFANGPFPAQVVSEGHKMLAQAPDLYLAGKAVKWGKGKIVKKFADEIHMAGTGTAPGLNFEWQSVLSFDGLVTIDIKMAPRKEPVWISDLKLNWSVPSKFCRAMLDPQLVKWDNKDGENFSFPYAHGQDFMIWTMGIKYGFLWHPVSPANWRNPNDHKQFTMKRTGSTVKINADFITVKSKLAKPAVYKMVFMATPTRKEPEKRRNANMGHIWGKIKFESWRVQYYLPSARLKDYSTEPWTGLVAVNPEKYQKHVLALKAAGTRYMPYCQPMMLESIDDYYDLFFKEWKQIPGYTCGSGVSFKTGEHYIPESCCGDTGAEDLGIWRADKHMADFPESAGIYYDCAQARMCSNPVHGCAGVDAFGKEYASAGSLRHRNFYIRLKRVMAKHGGNKYVFIHAHDRFVPFLHGVGDYFATGEQYFNTMVTNPKYFYAENVPLKRFQSAYYTPTKGTAILFSTAHYYNTYHKRTKEDCTGPEYTWAYMTACLIHDLNFGSGYINNDALEPWWVIKDRIKLIDADFHGYWFADAVKVSGKKVYASWYTWKKPSGCDALIIIGNMSREDQSVDLAIDWKKLGIDPARAVLTDLWTGKKLSGVKDLQVKNNNFRLIGIKK